MKSHKKGMGLSKHRISGHTPNERHFSGKTTGKPVRRKGKGKTRKQRKQNRHTHTNKYGQSR